MFLEKNLKLQRKATELLSSDKYLYSLLFFPNNLEYHHSTFSLYYTLNIHFLVLPRNNCILKHNFSVQFDANRLHLHQKLQPSQKVIAKQTWKQRFFCSNLGSEFTWTTCNAWRGDSNFWGGKEKRKRGRNFFEISTHNWLFFTSHKFRLTVLQDRGVF